MMKRILSVLVLFTVFAVTAQAQIKTNKLTNAAKSAANAASAANASNAEDVKKLSNGILTKLASALKLTDAQKPKVQEYVTSFIKSKSGIIGLASTDKTQYTSKLSGLTSDLTKKLKGTLTAVQMTKFLNLKSSKLSPTDELSQLFN